MIYFIYSLILFIGLIASQTRGGWLGYFVYLLALVFILFTNKNSLNRKECLKRVFALIIIFIVGFSVLSFSKGDNAVEKASISNISDSKGTVAQRLEIYKLCFKLISDNPFLGNGPDSLAYSLNKSYPEEFKEYIINHDVYIDKAHNELIEYAACEGILTVVLYLALLAIICFGLYKNIRNGINVDINIIILLAIIGYFVQSQSNISVIQVAPLFWILLGFASKVKNAKCNILTK